MWDKSVKKKKSECELEVVKVNNTVADKSRRRAKKTQIVTQQHPCRIYIYVFFYRIRYDETVAKCKWHRNLDETWTYIRSPVTIRTHTHTYSVWHRVKKCGNNYCDIFGGLICYAANDVSLCVWRFLLFIRQLLLMRSSAGRFANVVYFISDRSTMVSVNFWDNGTCAWWNACKIQHKWIPNCKINSF